MSFMPTSANLSKVDSTNVVSVVREHLQKNESASVLAWLLLGGKNFMTASPSSPFDFITASSKGLPKLSVINLATVLGIPIKDMAGLLNVSYKTLGRKKPTDVLDNITSSLSVELAYTISKGLSVFEDTGKFNRWLHKENRALHGSRPFDLLNTPTGVKLVNQVLGRIEEGVYS